MRPKELIGADAPRQLSIQAPAAEVRSVPSLPACAEQNSWKNSSKDRIRSLRFHKALFLPILVPLVVWLLVFLGGDHKQVQCHAEIIRGAGHAYT